MKTICVGLALWTGVGIGVATPVGAQASRRETMRDTTLANGLEIHVVENHAVPLVTEEIAVRNGAMAQDGGQEGIPHLYEHMLFKGYGGGQQEFQRELSDLHGEYNGFTSEESVGYYVTIASKKYGDGLSILARMLRDPDFDDDGLKREKAVVLNEFDRDMAHPEYQLQRAVEQRLWSTAWGRKNSLGEAGAIVAATPKVLATIYHEYYVPNNAALFVSGDVSADAVFNAARHAFDGWRRGPDPFVAHPVPPIPSLPSSKAVILTSDVQDVTILLVWQGPSVGETPDLTYAADVFSTLFDDPSAPAQLDLVSTGVFQELSLSYSTLHHVGPIELTGHTTVAALPRALAALKRELIACTRPGAFDDDALAGSRQARRVGRALSIESGSAAALRYADWWGIAGLDYYRAYPDRVAAVTSNDVTAYVETYLTQPYVIGVLGPKAATPDMTSAVRAFMVDSTMAAAQ
jgi:zinc protease